MLWIVLAFSVGMVCGVFAPDEVREFVRGFVRWVRGAWGWARDRIGGRAPAPVRTLLGKPTGPAGPSLGEAAANIARFFLGLLGWIARNWRLVLCVLTVVVILSALSALKGCFSGSPFGESREAAIVRADRAEAEVGVKETELQRNEEIGRISTGNAVARVQITVESERGRHAIEAATPEAEQPIDAELVAAWRGALDGLCVYARPDGSFPDTCGGGA